ncbi:MAG: hypothetical protein Q8M08_13335 [Bacteroidales bacterium]|nr:hypothetical protein [Bacteroidales bacterium]
MMKVPTCHASRVTRHVSKPFLVLRRLFHNPPAFGVVFDEPDEEGGDLPWNTLLSIVYFGYKGKDTNFHLG